MLTNNDFKFFAFLAFFWVGLGWLAFTLAMAGFFYGGFFVVYFLLGISTLLIFQVKTNFIAQLSREFFLILIGALATVILFSNFVTSSVFTGRDQGSISEAALRLSQHHQLKFSTPVSTDFFKIHEAGRAQNFPGFHYTGDGQLVTQFPLPYVAWLALFYSLLGMNGLLLGNAVLLFLFICAFYLLLRHFLRINYALLGTVLATTTFTTFWFFKFTLSENLALTLFWLGVLSLINFLKEKNNLNYFSLLTTFALLFFTRIEGVIIFPILFTLFLLHQNNRRFVNTRIIQRLLWPTLIFCCLLAGSLAINLSYYTEMAKVFLKNGRSLIAGDVTENSLTIFFLYGLLPVVILGILGIINLLRQKKYETLVPFFLALPAFAYLLNPQISDDHPWLLRRFAWAVLPVLIFNTVIFLASFKNKKFLIRTLVVILLATNTLLFVKYLPFSENQNLQPQVEKLSQRFSATDLVLVDRLATGDGYSLMSGPLHTIFGKNAAYFFNPADLAKLDTTKYAKIYLIAPDSNLAFWQNSVLGAHLRFSENYALQTQRLNLVRHSALPEKQGFNIHGKIFEILPIAK